MPESVPHDEVATHDEKESARRKWQSTVDKFFAKELRELPETEAGLRRRQRKILLSLPPNFVEEMDGFLRSKFVKRSKSPDFVPDRSTEELYLRGEIFERLVEAEDNLYHFDQEWKEHRQTDEQRRVGEMLLELMANPKRFNFPKETIKNPDLVSIIFEKDVYYICVSIEAKTHLDRRSFLQLLNFRETLLETARWVNELEDAASHGLAGLGKGGYQIAVSDRYAQILAVPGGCLTPGDRKSYDKIIDGHMPARMRAELIGLLSDSSRVRVARSAFNMEELKALVKYIHAKIGAD